LKDVAKAMSIPFSTVEKWYSKRKKGISLENKKKSGRPKILSRRAKIVIAKSVGKRRQSTRKLASRLTAIGEKCSAMTVHRYLAHDLGCKSFKRRKIPKLSEKNISDRKKFAKMVKKFKRDDWHKVIFTDESPFKLNWSPNSQIDRVWAKSPNDVPPVKKQKYSEGLQVWGGMTATGLTDLVILPQNLRLNAENYQTIILEKALLPSLDRTDTVGPVSKRMLVKKMSDFIFQHDGAPAHFAHRTEEWLK